MFNMFLMRRELVDKYCRWLFPILEELERRIGGENLSAFQGRLYGRVSEILFNVWLEEEKKQGKTVFEVACIYIDKINWRRKIISFLRAKFLGKKYERSF